ncbi:acyl-CoA-binding domain-containing protein 4 [Pyrus x bretschneideri]|uniref:acyl-CoA-binding domain-containing protein 4 n=1 Tax=Pyrus x bretschneideri TaxID=225117 RepID=UPI00202FF6E8|nr:acyl-CoA-binding domain-containing protein 4 [Pyrus x bretschneideri]
MGSLGGEAARKKAMWLYPKIMGFNPSERWGHSACYSRGALYIFGGCCGGMHFSDVLVLDLEKMVWNTLVSTGQGPGPRDSHSCIVLGHKMIVFGGTNGSKKVNDLHILNLVTKEWTRPECTGTPPSPRESHTATLVGDEKLVIFGGSGEGKGNYLNDLHVLDLNTMRWTSPEVKGDSPVPRDSHSTIVMGKKLLVYGGDRGDRYYGGVDMLDMNTLTWSRLAVQGSSPGARAGHATVSIGTKVYVIGGVGDKHYYNDVWVLDVITCSWTQLEICGQHPQGRFSHTAVVTDSDIAVYGGCGEDERPLNELLVLHLGAEHLNGRYNVSMCKIFGSQWNQERRRISKGADFNTKTMLMGNHVVVRQTTHGPESEAKRSLQFKSDTLHPKRRRTASTKSIDLESEQEEHSLSLSQHSSPSHSDQEQIPNPNIVDSNPGSRGFHLFKKFNHSPSNGQSPNVTSSHKANRNSGQRSPDLNLLGECHTEPKREQYHHVNIGRPSMQFQAVEQKHFEAGPIQNMMGAEVQGKVDGAFDSGFLMTAMVNGKIYRGVLFAPGPQMISRRPAFVQNPSSSTSQIPISGAKPFPNSNHPEPPLKLSEQPMRNSMPESGLGLMQPQVARPFSVIRANPSVAKERSDLPGVFLTLGGPGSPPGGS